MIFTDIDIHHYCTVASPILEATIRKLLVTKNFVIEIMKLFKHKKFEYYIFGATWYVLDSVHHSLYIQYNVNKVNTVHMKLSKVFSCTNL